MANEVVNAITQIAATIRSISGLQQVPINPPETISYAMFGLVYATSGSMDIAPIGTVEALHNIAIDILRKRVDLGREIAALNPFLDSVPAALLAECSDGGDFFSNTIETFGKLTYSWIATDYGGVPVVGYHFVAEGVKIQVNL